MSDNLQVGSRYWWRFKPSGGYGFTTRKPVTVVRLAKNRAFVVVDGAPRPVSVPRSSLSPLLDARSEKWREWALDQMEPLRMNLGDYEGQPACEIIEALLDDPAECGPRVTKVAAVSALELLSWLESAPRPVRAKRAGRKGKASR